MALKKYLPLFLSLIHILLRALERIGLQAEGYAKDLCPVDTGQLRKSISNAVDEAESTVYIGTNLEYAPFVEFGTGQYAEGGGRPTPWVYKDRCV